MGTFASWPAGGGFGGPIIFFGLAANHMEHPGVRSSRHARRPAGDSPSKNVGGDRSRHGRIMPTDVT